MSQTLYSRPASFWTEAQPLGNGSIGAMVFGGTDRERIALNHDTLWTGIPSFNSRDGLRETFERARALALDGNYTEAHRVITEGFETKRTARYQPFGDLLIDFPAEADVSGYSRRLSLDDALLTVSYQRGGVTFTREQFCSNPDRLLAVRMSADRPGELSFSLTLTSPMRHTLCADGASLLLDGECPLTYDKASPIYSEQPGERGIRFRGGLRLVTDGSVCAQDGRLIVTDASEALLLFTITTSFLSWDRLPEGEYEREALDILEAGAALGWERLLTRHLEDYHRLFDAISLDLGSSGREELPTDERLRLFEEDGEDISLYTLYFDFGRYLTIAGSRAGSQAMNLQGIWNESCTPPWSCNYTVNINTEMNYWPTLMCGLDECYEPLFRFIADRAVSGRRTAKTFYGAPGWVMHHNSDIWAYTTPAIDGNAMWGFWHGGSGWFCHHLYEYYEYTGDLAFLREKAYPVMLEAAVFYHSLLVRREDGKLSVCPMTSPENRFMTDGGSAAVAKWTAMSDSIAYSLFSDCKKAAQTLGIEPDGVLADILAALPDMEPLKIASDGRIMEWNEEFGETEVTHRHVSHLWALYPARMITPDGTPELSEACRRSLDRRGDRGTGWSLGWKINLWARLGDGERACRLLDTQLHFVSPEIDSYKFRGGTYPNLFDAHPPFQIDGNFAAVSGILEMLAVQRPTSSGADELVLLPALPAKWRSGSLRGLRLRGGRVLDLRWQDGQVTECTVR
ncbi:MAG: glycoside hydrolase N-terminal domain-containing protein [Clostridia bacterium]|nr:glycoside hydrolase N-terminal domain-containing protein [Clostridia bacterium]